MSKKSISKYSKMMFQFAKNDLKKRYSGSLLGFFWAYIQPLVVILVFWFVFEKGLRNAPVDNVEFILWFVPAYIAWTFISDSIMQSSNVLYEYSYLVKKVKFKIEILPPVKVLSSLLIHSFFIVFCFVLYLIYGKQFSVYWFQALYYCFAATVFLFGLSLLVASLSVFWKDIVQLVNVLLQIGFWLVPVFWNPKTLQDETIGKILRLNPFYYIVNGYRESFIDHYGFYEHYWQTLYFWVFTIIICALGIFSFKKLSKHYSDLL